HLEHAVIGLLLPGNHPEQRCLSSAVRSDDANDPAAWQREAEILDEQVIPVRFAEVTSFDDDVPEPGPGRDVNLSRLDSLRRVFAQQLFVRIQACFALRLSRA